MNVHNNARLTPRGRGRIVRQVESGQTPDAVAEAAVPSRQESCFSWPQVREGQQGARLIPWQGGA